MTFRLINDVYRCHFSLIFQISNDKICSGSHFTSFFTSFFYFCCVLQKHSIQIFHEIAQKLFRMFMFNFDARVCLHFRIVQNAFLLPFLFSFFFFSFSFNFIHILSDSYIYTHIAPTILKAVPVPLWSVSMEIL